MSTIEQCGRCGGAHPVPCTRRGRDVDGKMVGEMVFLCQKCWRRAGKENAAARQRSEARTKEGS